MTTTLHLTIDCAEPDRLVGFWAAALGYERMPAPAGHDTWRAYYLSIGEPESELGDGDACDRLIDPNGAGPAIWFQIVPEPKTVKNRLHLDLFVGGGREVPVEERRPRVDAKAAQMTTLGATTLYSHDADGHYGITMADPEGNEFCIT